MDRRGFLVSLAAIPLVSGLNVHNGAIMSATVSADVVKKLMDDYIADRNGIKRLEWTRVCISNQDRFNVVVEFES